MANVPENIYILAKNRKIMWGNRTFNYFCYLKAGQTWQHIQEISSQLLRVTCFSSLEVHPYMYVTGIWLTLSFRVNSAWTDFCLRLSSDLIKDGKMIIWREHQIYIRIISVSVQTSFRTIQSLKLSSKGVILVKPQSAIFYWPYSKQSRCGLKKLERSWHLVIT